MEGDGPVAIAVGPIERPEPLAPLGCLEELVRVVEGVARFVAQVPADLADVFEIVELLLETRQLGVGQVERDSDDRLLGRAPPLVREIRGRVEALESLGLEVPVEVGDVSLHGRALELEPEPADALAKQGFQVGSSRFERGHAVPLSYPMASPGIVGAINRTEMSSARSGRGGPAVGGRVQVRGRHLRRLGGVGERSQH
jgi:hypothetical protein